VKVSRLSSAVNSLASFRVGRQTLYVLPFRSLAYAAVSAAIVIALLIAIDRFVLGSLERAGWTAGELWGRHNKLVEENHRRKTTTNECELRHWTGQPLPRDDVGRHKILVLGDSFVWGPPYTTLNHLWWRQLAIELERRGYRNVDVVAAGHPGWSTRRQLACAKELVPAVKPDLMIWGYVTNDPDEKLVRSIFDSQDRPPYGQRIRSRLKRYLPNLTFKFESLRADKLAVQYAGPEYGYAYPDWELKLVEGENFAKYRQTIGEVGQFVRDANVPAFLHTLPHIPSREYFEPRYAPVLKEWQSAGVLVNNTALEFVGRYGNFSEVGKEALQWGINPSDSHPGPKATHFHAVTAADFIEQCWPEVLGPKDAAQPHDLVINDWLPYDLNVRQTGEQTFELDYPATTDLMPRPPGDEPAAMVALRYPLPIEEIRIEAKGLGGSRIWISMLDPKEHFDEDRWREVAVQVSGHSIVCRLPVDLAGRDLAEIRFQADIAGKDRRVHLTLVRTAPIEERR
jgi:hypothetical protein